MDSTFEYRTRSYRASVMLLVVSTLLTMVGFGTSHWVDMGDSHYGLWLDCPQTSGCVHHHDDTPVEEILRIPQLLIILDLSAQIIACVIAVFVNSRRYVPRPRQRYLEVVVGFAGLLGLVGSTTFWVHKQQLDTAMSRVTVLSWSFYLVFFPSCVNLAIAIAISCDDDIEPGIDDDIPLALPGL